MLNKAKSISKGLVKISETVVNSVVSKSKPSNTSGSGTNTSGISPRLAGTAGSGSNKIRHDSKEDYQAGICTVIDTCKYTNTSRRPQSLHDENQTWILAHFLAHQEPIYALEFNHNGRLLVSADCLGQYFNVFQLNINSMKSTRTSVKHLYSLYRGDTSSKVRNMCFSADSRWLAISTKRGTTHIFPINMYGGAVNARTHSKCYVVNKTSKHQRTAGFLDPDEFTAGGAGSAASCGKMPLLNNNGLLNQANGCTGEMYNMMQAYDGASYSSPIVLNNNPKLKSLLEPFVISAYGQLKQPNANSAFQSSVISTNPSCGVSTSSTGLLTTAPQTQITANNSESGGNNSSNVNAGNLLNANTSTGVNLAATAFSSAALVTENVTNLGIKNFSLLASNTTNLIQYDNVYPVAMFAESRGYLSPEEPRDFTINRLKPANSLFIISDVNGNLVEYVLDVVVDTSKTPGNKATNDSPILLKITPKAQWPLQRFISSNEIRYPIGIDNPLMGGAGGLNSANIRKHTSSSSSLDATIMPTVAATDMPSLNYIGVSNGFNSYSPNSLISNSPYLSANSSFNPQYSNSAGNNTNSNDWIKMIEVNTHIGPHRRLFMGPQFVFKTFNSSLTTTMLNAASSSVISDNEALILNGDIELNSLDLTSAAANSADHKYLRTTSPMQIGNNQLHLASSYSRNMKQKFVDCTPTYIEVGSGSFQEGMPILSGSTAGGSSGRGSQKSLNSIGSAGPGSNGSGNGGGAYHHHHHHHHHGDEANNTNLIESLADAMNELNTTTSGSSSANHSPLIPINSMSNANNTANYRNNNHNNNNNNSNRNRQTSNNQYQQKNSIKPTVMPNTTPAIAIATNQTASKQSSNLNASNLLLMNTANTIPVATSPPQSESVGSVFTVGSYFLVNQAPTLINGMTTQHSPAATVSGTNATNVNVSNSCTSSSRASSSSTNSSNNEDDSLSSNGSLSLTHGNMIITDSRRGSKQQQPSIEGFQFQDDNLQ